MFAPEVLAGTILSGLLYLAPRILILVAIIFYLNKKKTPDAILMLIGTILGILVTSYNTWVLPVLLQSQLEDKIYQNVILSSIPNLIALVGFFMFALGFFILFLNLFKKGKGLNNELDERIDKINT